MIIDPTKIEDNPGLRHIAKLLLNSLWGKFGMRNTLPRQQVVARPADFYSLLYDPRYEIVDIIEVSEDVLRLAYKPVDGFFAEEHAQSNPVVALLTTDYARVTLHQYMQQVESHPSCRCLYSDTVRKQEGRIQALLHPGV